MERPPEDVGENVIRNFWKGWRKYGVGSPGPSYIETGIEWNRMRPEAKALLGISEGWEFNGYLSAYLSLTLTGVSVGLRCQTIIVARIRRNFCQRRK